MRSTISKLKARAEAERQRVRAGSGAGRQAPGPEAERRQQDRVRPREETFVVPSDARGRELRLDQVLGEVEDVGSGGLSFRRLDSSPVDPQGVRRVDLIQTGGGRRLAALGCELVYDQAEPDAAVRRCGLRFLHLDPAQRSELSELIRRGRPSRG
jgi:c-di-GMP-binding flagellar brake protein YcgR